MADRHDSTARSDVKSERVDDYITNYTPAHPHATGCWSTIGPTCRDVTRRMQPASVPAAHRILWTTAPFIGWAHTAGIALTIEDIFTPDNVDRYVTVVADGTLATQRTIRATLRRVGPHVTRKAPWPPKPRSLGRNPIARPYSTGDVRRLIVAIDHQSNLERRDLMRVVLGLGLGCGIDGRAALTISPADIHISLFGVDVTVAGRQVPCLHQYAPLLHDAPAVLARRPRQRLFASDQARSRFLKVTAGRDTAIKLARLRSTWLLHHLTIGTPLAVLLPAANLRTASMLTELIALVEPVSTERAAELLRGTTR